MAAKITDDDHAAPAMGHVGQDRRGIFKTAGQHGCAAIGFLALQFVGEYTGIECGFVEQRFDHAARQQDRHIRSAFQVVKKPAGFFHPRR